MPQVASDTKTHALKHQQPRPARPAERASSASPFERLIDDGAPPAAKPKPSAKAERGEQGARTQDTQAPAKPKSAKATRENDDSQSAGKTAPADKTVKPEATDAAKVHAEPIEPSTDEIAAATDGQPPATDAKPADVPVVAETVATLVPAVADAVAAALTPTAEPAAADPVEAAAVAGETPKAKPGAADIVQADPENPADAAESAQAPVASTAATPDEPVPAAKTATHTPDGVKPHHATPGEGDRQAVAQARGETPAHAQHTAAEAPAAASGADAPAPKADVVPPQHLPAPSHAQATAASAPAHPLPAPQPAAVPFEGVAVEIAGKALAGKNHFEIRLDPPELGRIEVRLHIDRDGNVSSRLIADRQDTLDLLRREGGSLERALQDAGLKTSDNGLQFSLRDQSGQHRDEGRADARPVVDDETPSSIEALPRDYGRLAGRIGGLDIQV